MDILSHNRAAWNKRVVDQNRWTVPASLELIARARNGDVEIVLTPAKPVPLSWFPPLNGAATLCLASGGGQQAPILAAAGALVTVFDNSPKQLAQDRLVADRENLQLQTVEGDMADLSVFPSATFDLIVHPCSNCFVPNIRPVWQECARVLRPGCLLLAGFCNPVRWIFDDERAQNGSLEVRHKIPYSDLTSLDEAARQKIITEEMRPLEFGHSLSDQIAGQLEAGLLLTALYEDKFEESTDPISRYLDTFIATRAIKPEK